jgi:hypothetical protein
MLTRANFRLNYVISAILGRLQHKLPPETMELIHEHFLEELRPYGVVQFVEKFHNIPKIQKGSRLIQ